MRRIISENQEETIKLTTQNIQTEQTFINTIIHNNDEKYKYIFNNESVIQNGFAQELNTINTNNTVIILEELTENDEYIWKLKGDSRIGKTINIELMIPNYLTTKLAKPEEDDYALNDDKNMFADDHKYDYLRNVSTKQVYAMKEDSFTRLVYLELIENHQYQSRLGNPWLTLCAILRTLETLRIEPILFRKILNILFKNNTNGPKFYYRNRVTTLNDTDMPSILPTLLYTFMNLTIAYILGTLNEIDYYFCLNAQFEFCKESFFDSRLKAKSTARNYFQEAVSNLNVVSVPNWNVRLVAHSMKLRDVKESGLVLDEIKLAKDKRKEKLSKTMNNFIDQCLKLKNIDDVINSLNIVRYATNCGEYINTLTELSVDKAVRPTIRGDPVLRSIVKTEISRPDSAELDRLPLDVEFENDYEKQEARTSKNVEDWNIRSMMQKYYYNPRIKAAVRYVSTIDFDEEWAKFMTVKSPGNIPELEDIDLLTKQLRDYVTKSRIGFEMFTSEKYRDIEFADSDILGSQKMNNRTQIDRRARAISGTSNVRMKNALPGYLIESYLYKYSTAAIQGKQKGDVSDLKDMLRYTITDNVMISSSDINGMDTSIQSLFKEVITSFILKVLFEAGNDLKAKNQSYGPYNVMKAILVEKETNKVLKHCILSAPFMAAVRDASLRTTSTTYQSKLFKELKTQEGTFGSGNPDTGSHHTLQLDSIYTAGDKMLVKSGKIKTSISTSIMGDDIERVYMGRERIMQENALIDLKLLRKMGMESDFNISKSTGVFLQQQVTCGRLVAYPDRISFTTKERGNENLNSEQKAKELLALVDDISSRIPRSHHLHVLSFFLLGFTCRRRVLSVSPEDISTLSAVLNDKNIDFKVYDDTENENEFEKKVNDTSDGNENSKRSTRTKTRVLCSIIRPLVWVFCHKGGNLPSFKFQRRDGTFTSQERMTAVRGYVQRRLMYDISGCFDGDRIHDKLDYELLDEYGFLDSQLIIDVKLDSFFEEQQLDYETKAFIDKTANDFLSHQDPGKYNRSRQAYGRLAKMGIKIGRSQVYAYSLHTRAEQVITDKLSVPFLSSYKLMYFIDKYKLIKNQGTKILMKKSDETILYRFKKVKDLNVGYNEFSKAVDLCRIGPSMEKFEPSWMLYKFFGPIDQITSEGRNILSIISGKFRGFNYSDPIFKEGYSIYRKRSTRHMIDDYFDAVGIFDPATRINMIRVFEQVSQGLSFIVEFDTNPRRYFWNSTDISEADRYLRSAPIVIIQDIDLSKIFAQTALYISMCANPYAFINGPLCDIEYHESLYKMLKDKVVKYNEYTKLD